MVSNENDEFIGEIATMLLSQILLVSDNERIAILEDVVKIRKQMEDGEERVEESNEADHKDNLVLEDIAELMATIRSISTQTIEMLSSIDKSQSILTQKVFFPSLVALGKSVMLINQEHTDWT